MPRTPPRALLRTRTLLLLALARHRLVFSLLFGVLLAASLAIALLIIPPRLALDLNVFHPGPISSLRWPEPVPGFWPAPEWSEHRSGFGAVSAHFQTSLPRGRFHDYYAVHMRTTGWPSSALRTRWQLFAQSEEAMSSFVDRLPRTSGGRLRSRTAVLWPGLAVNTALYGVVTFLIWSAPAFLRHCAGAYRDACTRLCRAVVCASAVLWALAVAFSISYYGQSASLTFKDGCFGFFWRGSDPQHRNTFLHNNYTWPHKGHGAGDTWDLERWGRFEVYGPGFLSWDRLSLLHLGSFGLRYFPGCSLGPPLAYVGLPLWTPTMIGAYGWLVLRRSRRERETVCLGCGYSRLGLPAHAVCPECGR
jgi:hypothetical protein